jgi:hypothetical protein
MKLDSLVDAQQVARLHPDTFARSGDPSSASLIVVVLALAVLVGLRVGSCWTKPQQFG